MRFLTAAEMATELQISTRTLGRMVDAGLPVAYAGRLQRFDAERVNEWLHAEGRRRRGGRPRKALPSEEAAAE